MGRGRRIQNYDDLPDMFDDVDEGADDNDIDPDRRPISDNIADEFDDLSPRIGEKRKDLRTARSGDPDMSVIAYSKEPAPTFPMHIMSSRLQKVVRDVAVSAGSTLDFAFASVYSCASMAIGNSVRIELKRGYNQPAIIWTQIVGGPSTNKSPAIRIAMRALTEVQNRLKVPYKAAHAQWKREDELAQQFRKDFETKRKAMIASGQEVSADIPQNCISPQPPEEPLLVMNDTSMEAFYNRQATVKRGFGVFRDELAAFMADMERYGNISNRAAWLEAYEGGPHSIDRVKNEGKIIEIDAICAPILGGIQPERLAEIVSHQVADDGFQARFFPFFPDDFEADERHTGDDVEILTSAYERLATMPMDKAKDGRPIPYVLPLTKKAFDFYWDWNAATKKVDKRADVKLQGVFGKARGHVARFALVLEHLEWALDEFSDEYPSKIPLKSIKAAIDFRQEYLKPMQKRVWQLANETSELSVARRIANHIVEMRYEIVNARELRRNSGIKGLNSHTVAEAVDQAIGFLVEKRWLFPIEEEKKSRGRPKKDFKVNPRIWKIIDGA